MDKKIAIIAGQLVGLKAYEWYRIRRVVDTLFNSEAVKVQLNDSERLEELLGVEFGLRRYGEERDEKKIDTDELVNSLEKEVKKAMDQSVNQS